MVSTSRSASVLDHGTHCKIQADLWRQKQAQESAQVKGASEGGEDQPTIRQYATDRMADRTASHL